MAFMAGDDFRPQILAPSASRQERPHPSAICTETQPGNEDQGGKQRTGPERP